MRVLVAGIGNIFFGDDGFGPAVARRLAGADLPEGVDVRDYGIRGVHLAYDMLDGLHQTLLIVDAVPLGDAPGTLAVIEVGDPGCFGVEIDAHSMSPATVLAALSAVGGTPGRVLVVGCEPERFDHGMCLSPAVASAVGEASALVVALLRDETSVLLSAPGRHGG